MFYSYYLSLVFGTLLPLIAADSCNDNFSPCSPKGASDSGAPAVGTSLSTLYVDILDSINKVQNVRRELGQEDRELKVRASGALCCTVTSPESCGLIADICHRR